ncbi:MAG: hypothetical protein K2X11_17270 [Acetobacteraceae bacterium]|nr:hypothetical protein [Acetobacteraceae bacterium]
MTRFALPLLLAGLVACAPARDPSEVAIAAMTNAECRTEAQGDPEVRRLFRQANFEDTFGIQHFAEERRVAMMRAYQSCLRARGLPGAGGVEVVRFR